jgi:hypothetical protein
MTVKADLTKRGKNVLLASAAAVTLILVWSFVAFAPEDKKVMPYAQKIMHATRPQAPITTLDLSRHSKHNLSPTFSYRRRSIKTKHYVGKKETFNVVKQPLFDTPHILGSNHLTATNIDNLPPLTLRVPSSPKVDTSILSFGVATTIPHLNESVPQFQHWLPGTSYLLQVLVPHRNDDLILEGEIRSLGINLTITPSDLPFPKAYFSLIKQLCDTRTPKTKWLVLIDDDMFIPSLPTLVNASTPNTTARRSHDRAHLRRPQSDSHLWTHPLRQRRDLPLRAPCRSPHLFSNLGSMHEEREKSKGSNRQ